MKLSHILLLWAVHISIHFSKCEDIISKSLSNGRAANNVNKDGAQNYRCVLSFNPKIVKKQSEKGQNRGNFPNAFADAT